MRSGPPDAVAPRVRFGVVRVFEEFATVADSAVGVGEGAVRGDGHDLVCVGVRAQQRRHAGAYQGNRVHGRKRGLVGNRTEERRVAAAMRAEVRHGVADGGDGYATGHCFGRQVHERPEREMAAGRRSAKPYLVGRETGDVAEGVGEEPVCGGDAVVAACRPAVGLGRETVFDVEDREAEVVAEELGDARNARAVEGAPAAAVDEEDDGGMARREGRAVGLR